MIKENDIYLLLGKNIRKYRKLYNANIGDMTQRELAEKIGTSTSLISGLESRNITQGIGVYNLYKISKALNVPIEKFFE